MQPHNAPANDALEDGGWVVELTRFRGRSRYAATFAAAYCFSKSIGLT